MAIEFKRFPEFHNECLHGDSYWKEREARALVKFVAKNGCCLTPEEAEHPYGYMIFDPLLTEDALITVDKIARAGYPTNPLEYSFDPVAKIIYHERTYRHLDYGTAADELAQVVATASTKAEREIASLKKQFKEMPDDVYARLLPMRDFFLSMASSVFK